MTGKNILIFKNLKIYYEYYGFNRETYVNEKVVDVMLLRKLKDPTQIAKDSRKYFSKKKDKNEELEELGMISKPKKGEIKAVDDTSFAVSEGESVSLIGETGSGKSTILVSIFNFPQDNLSLKSGQILYNDIESENQVDLLTLSDQEMNRYRGLHFGLIPQLPKGALNPWISIGVQAGEVLKERTNMEEEKVRERVVEFLGKVALPDPKTYAKKYSQHLSIGEAQKICIALALTSNPKILVGDEIFSSLDPISQSQVIHLLLELKKDFNLNYLLATHNIGAAAQVSDNIGVIYGGECVEYRKNKIFFKEPLHPYSQMLLESEPWYAMSKGKDLREIPGELPEALYWPTGCKFHPRCPKAMPKCQTNKPPRVITEFGFVDCFLYEE
ncbi:MAG: ABC transporter ATP-binding protein [Candidatus Hodarchaeales archaeon]|jgi:oligopeptide/dipeptide ABC transporter ATP-binding protein